ncbi:MAG: N-acetylglucosamine-6-phosphate deacetylase [Atopobiaceae bacterium]|jgi:N-acetylglucosamine-6-phosphate deacetylase
MSTQAIKSDHIILPGGIDGFGYVLIRDGKFQGVTIEEPDSKVEIIDRMGCWVAPGYVDTHVHGFLDHDVMDCDPDGINIIAEGLLRHGTTSWLPTTLTASVETTKRACEAVTEAEKRREPGYLGARTQGIFLEGPFFTEEHKGAQNPKYLCDPSIKAYDIWQKACHHIIKKSALAPERDHSQEYIHHVTADGCVAAIGHTSATYAEAAAAVLAGAKVFVHTYNAMSGLHHRDPGAVGCAMTSQDTYSELICDGQHVNPVAADALIRAKGWEHVFLITDCLRCGGMPDGNYFLGELPIVLSGGAAHLKEGGNLAGSVLTMAGAVKNVVDWGLVTAEQAIRMATEVAARANNIEDACGSILPGRDADLVVLNPDLTLAETYLGGIQVLPDKA